jgi:hypothetical protein
LISRSFFVPTIFLIKSIIYNHPKYTIRHTSYKRGKTFKTTDIFLDRQTSSVLPAAQRKGISTV